MDISSIGVVGAGQMLPEFDAAVVGMKAGESKTFPLTFPADYRAENLAGKQRDRKSVV
jgi:trigger factor